MTEVQTEEVGRKGKRKESKEVKAKTNGAVHPQSIYAAYGRDPIYEKEGKLFVLQDGSEWWLIPTDTQRARNALSEARIKRFEQLKEYADRGEDVPDEITYEVMAEYLAYGLVVKNNKVRLRDGSFMEYSEENTEKLLKDPYLHRLCSHLHDLADAEKSFWPEFIKDAEGNSENT